MHHIVKEDSYSLAPVWINNKEFLAYFNRKSSVNEGLPEEVLMHYRNVVNIKMNKWEGTVIMSGVQARTPTALKNIWNSFDVVYTMINNYLWVLWTEDGEGKPGDWQKKEHVSKIIKHLRM